MSLFIGKNHVLGFVVVAVLFSGATSSAFAQETQPGDACTAGEAGWFKRTEMNPSSEGGNMMFCNGSTWMGIMRFTSSGNLGIWNDIPESELDISGTGQMDILRLRGSSGLTAPITSFGMGGLWSVGSGDDIYYNSGTPMVGIGVSDPEVALDVLGDIEYTGVITDVSDRRLKKEIADLPVGQLDKLLSLQGVSFKMDNELSEQTEFGFVAQDVQLVYPELIRIGGDGMLSMNYVGLISPIVESIKEQDKIIENQRVLIDEMSAQLSNQREIIERLSDRIESLEKK